MSVAYEYVAMATHICQHGCGGVCCVCDGQRRVMVMSHVAVVSGPVLRLTLWSMAGTARCWGPRRRETPGTRQSMESGGHTHTHTG